MSYYPLESPCFNQSVHVLIPFKSSLRSSLFEFIAEARADIASVDEQEFRFQRGQRDWPIMRGPIFYHLSLRARVRKEHAPLVPRLNEAIACLKITSQIDTLIGQAMRGEIYEKDN